jgi:hypothetical protein
VHTGAPLPSSTYTVSPSQRTPARSQPTPSYVIPIRSDPFRVHPRTAVLCHVHRCTSPLFTLMRCVHHTSLFSSTQQLNFSQHTPACSRPSLLLYVSTIPPMRYVYTARRCCRPHTPSHFHSVHRLAHDRRCGTSASLPRSVVYAPRAAVLFHIHHLISTVYTSLLTIIGAVRQRHSPVLCVYTPTSLLSSTYTNQVSRRIQYRLAHSVYSTGSLETVTTVRHCHSLHASCVNAYTTVLVHVHRTVLTGRTALSVALPAAPL